MLLQVRSPQSNNVWLLIIINKRLQLKVHFAVMLSSFKGLISIIMEIIILKTFNLKIIRIARKQARHAVESTVWMDVWNSNSTEFEPVSLLQRLCITDSVMNLNQFSNPNLDLCAYKCAKAPLVISVASSEFLIKDTLFAVSTLVRILSLP